MSDIEALDDDFRQVRCRGRFGFQIAPQFERASAAREPKPVQPTTMEPAELPVCAAAARPFVETATDYDSLIEAFRIRASQLDLSRQNIDEIAGYPDRLASKLLGPGKVKRLGLLTLGGMLSALGLKILIVENEETLERYRGLRIKRDASHVASATARWERPADAQTRRSRSRK
jgi:hypothetical protein